MMSGGRREAEALRAIEAQIEAMAEGAPACFVLDDAADGVGVASGGDWDSGVAGGGQDGETGAGDDA